MRKQYYFRDSPRGVLAWDVDRLVELTRELPPRVVAVNAVLERNDFWVRAGETMTVREMVEHIQLVEAADLSYPIILSARGEVMDGMHRLTKALREGRQTIAVVQFSADPDPDHVGLGPDELP